MKRFLKRAVSALRAAWSREPVLIGAVPALVAEGVLTAQQASTITHAAGAVATGLSALLVKQVRSIVDSPATKAAAAVVSAPSA